MIGRKIEICMPSTLPDSATLLSGSSIHLHSETSSILTVISGNFTFATLLSETVSQIGLWLSFVLSETIDSPE